MSTQYPPRTSSSCWSDSSCESDFSTQTYSTEKYVLVVEDEPLVAEIVEEIVASLGMSTLIAGDGEIGVELFRKHRQNIACVILDYELPGMHSSVALAQFRELKPEVRIILSSGYPTNELSGYFDSVDCFIGKPYAPETLIWHLRKVFETS